MSEQKTIKDLQEQVNRLEQQIDDISTGNTDDYKTSLNEELSKAKKTFKDAKELNEPKHKLSRRIENSASIMVFLGLIGVLLNSDIYSQHFDVVTLSFEWNFGLSSFWFLGIICVFWLLVLSIPCLVAECYGQVVKVFNSLLCLSLFLFEFYELAPVLLLMGVGLFLTVHSINRKFGYTRAWSRNKLFINKIKIFEAELESKLDTPANIRAKLYQFFDDAQLMVHRDVIMITPNMVMPC